ncbi:MFS transporter [Nanoarchaeota archaeon]
MVTKREPKEPRRIKALKKEARNHNIKEGVFATIKDSFGVHFISPFAIAINSSNAMVAMLSSITGLLGPLSQISGSKLIEKYSRKKILLRAVLLEAFVWLPLILLAFLFNKGILTNMLPMVLLLFFSIYIIFLNVGHPAWFSWTGDIVDEKYRGRWFSKRTLIIGFISVVLAIGASFFLDYFKNMGLTMYGFMILFFLAFLARLMSWKIYKKEYEPKLKLKKGHYFSFGEFLLNAPKNNFGKFAIFRAFLGFATTISSALIAIYLLRQLGFAYTTYMIITLAGAFFSLIVLELWGKFADKYGNYRVLRLTSALIPLVPILWILHPSPLYLIFVPQLVGGIAWAGFHLSAGNFIYDNVSKQKRGLAVSYYNMLLGMGVFLGAGLGALLIKYLTTNLLESIFTIFVISGIIRLIVVFWGIPKVKEIKKIGKFKSSRAIKDIVFKHGKSTLLEEAHEIMSIKKYLNTK